MGASTSDRAGIGTDGTYLDAYGFNNSVWAVGSYVTIGSDVRGPLMVGLINSSTLTLGVRGNWVSNVPNGTPNGLPTSTFGVLSMNSGNFGYNMAANLRGATIGGGMTSAQWALFSADWDAFNAMLRRNVP